MKPNVLLSLLILGAITGCGAWKHQPGFKPKAQNEKTGLAATVPTDAIATWSGVDGDGNPLRLEIGPTLVSWTRACLTASGGVTATLTYAVDLFADRFVSRTNATHTVTVNGEHCELAVHEGEATLYEVIASDRLSIIDVTGQLIALNKVP